MVKRLPYRERRALILALWAAAPGAIVRREGWLWWTVRPMMPPGAPEGPAVWVPTLALASRMAWVALEHREGTYLSVQGVVR